ncbi:hypothetical protein ACI65C_003950 [Semiaphis heraclei]
MGRRQTNLVKNLFFTYNIDKNESVCNIEGCRRPVLKGSVSHNLETHIRTTHPDEAIMLDKAKEDLKTQKFVNSGVKRQNDEDNSCSNKTFGRLDPRYQCMLNETDKNTGINHLIKTWKFMIQIQEDDVCQSQTDDVNNSAIASVNVDSPDNTTETTDDGFELFLSSQSSVSSNRSDTNILNDISVSLHNFKDVERLHYKTNILTFWESQKHDKFDLYKLAKVVLAVPATQVSVERSFSGIKFILSDLRTSLSANLLDAIMIVRSNTKFMK